MAQQKEKAKMLMKAITQGNVQEVRSIIDSGIQVASDEHRLIKNIGFVSSDYRKQPPLILAAKYGNKEIVKMLLDAGANLHDDLTNGKTPIIVAAENGHNDVVQMLINAGADVDDSLYETRQTPLMFAAKNGHYDVVKTLLMAGADKTLESYDSWTNKTKTAAEYAKTPEIKKLIDNFDMHALRRNYAMLLTEPVKINEKTGKTKPLPQLPTTAIQSILNFATRPGENMYKDPTQDPAYKVSENIYKIRQKKGTYKQPNIEVVGTGAHTILEPGRTYVFPKKGGRKSRKLKSKTRRSKCKSKTRKCK